MGSSGPVAIEFGPQPHTLFRLGVLPFTLRFSSWSLSSIFSDKSMYFSSPPRALSVLFFSSYSNLGLFRDVTPDSLVEWYLQIL